MHYFFPILKIPIKTEIRNEKQSVLHCRYLSTNSMEQWPPCSCSQEFLVFYDTHNVITIL
jgi:hypothetical protein